MKSYFMSVEDYFAFIIKIKYFIFLIFLINVYFSCSVNYNTADHIRNCLKSIYEFLNSDTTEVIVVDNNSTQI
ncbi:MAG: hypothetical protein R3A12_19215 [Ignavibacteria bacterium]